MQKVIKKLDTRNRVLIPEDFRKALHMAVDEDVELTLYGHGILISSTKPRCVVCGQPTKIKFKNQYICKECVVGISRL